MSRPVAGRHAARATGPMLPLEAAVEATPVGWSVRLPLRAEVVTLSKRTVVRETVRVWRRQAERVETRTETVRSERPRRDFVPRDHGDSSQRG